MLLKVDNYSCHVTSSHMSENISVLHKKIIAILHYKMLHTAALFQRDSGRETQRQQRIAPRFSGISSMLYPNFISDNRVFVASVIIISSRSWSDVCFLVLDFFTTFAKEDVIYGPVNKCAVLSRMLHPRYDSYPLKSQRDVYRNRCHASFLHCSNVVWLSVGLVLIDKHRITYAPYSHNHFFVESYTRCLSVRACVFNQKKITC